MEEHLFVLFDFLYYNASKKLCQQKKEQMFAIFEAFFTQIEPFSGRFPAYSFRSFVTSVRSKMCRWSALERYSSTGRPAMQFPFSSSEGP